jgi:uncharacterized coiled-coil protein SlyX
VSVTLSSLGQLLSSLSQLPDALTRITQLEVRMATQESVIAQIDAVTTAMGTDVGTLRQKLIDLQSAVDSRDQAAVSSAMDALAPSISNLETMENVLHALGSDPANPVPADAPTSPVVDPNISL